MNALEKVRSQYPDYKDVDDATLADALYKKFYSDMPRADYDAKLGLSSQPSAASAGFATREQRGEDEITQSEAFRTGLSQGATFGLYDEAAALTAAGEPKFAEAGQPMTEAERQAADLFGNSPAISPLEKFGAGVRDVAIRGAQPAQETYDRALAQERGAIRAAEQQYPWTTLAGNVAGGAIVPLPAAQGAKGLAAMSAGTGALYGFGTGESITDRLAQAAAGGAIGGALGGVVGKMTAPKAAAAPNAVVQAADNLGVSVPRAVASDSLTVQRMGQGVRNVPFAGERMVQAVAGVTDDLTRAADDVAAGLGSSDVARAGQAATGGIKDWITGKSKDMVTTAYNQVDNLVKPDVTTPLNSTAKVASEILAERQAARISDVGNAVSFVADAIQDRSGLTYEGIKMLRTRVGEMMKNPSMLPQGTSQAELKRIYSGLSDDLKDAVLNAGGKPALQAFERANQLNAAVAARRSELAKLVGQNADAPPEKVFDALLARASTTSRGDIQLLTKARQTIGDDWNEVGSAVISRLGRDAEGNLTPDRFLTAYSKISDEGKAVLFDGTTRKALDDIATISSRMKEVGSRFGNPSGTAQNVGFAAVGAGLMAEPVSTLSVLIGGNVLSRILSQPATASSAAKWSRAYELAVRQPSAASASALLIASRNLASTASDKLGLSITADQLVKGLSGPLRSAADQSNGQTQPEEQNSPR